MIAADSVLDLLCCAALEPRLGGMLFIDLDARTLLALSKAFAEASQKVADRPHSVVPLGSEATEEDMWLAWALTRSGPAVRPGRIVEQRDRPTPVFVIPDLALANLAVRQAVVCAVAADVVHVERHGRSLQWRPRGRWLAACAREDLATLSPHLLDRFPVRWEAAQEMTAAPSVVRRLQELMPGLDNGGRRERPRFAEESLALIAMMDQRDVGLRRDLALARASRAVAECHRKPLVTRDDVQRAAELLGMPGIRPDADPPSIPQTDSVGNTEPQVGGDAGIDSLDPASVDRGVGGNRTETDTRTADLSDPEPASDEAVHLDAANAPTRYPEDEPEALSAVQSLRRLQRRQSLPGLVCGPIIGDESTPDLKDLAIVPTLMRAAWRSLANSPGGRGPVGRLRVRREDLRRHRRAQVPGYALVLVLDHTSHRHWNFAPALAPHLRWAYECRAMVSVIDFGHHQAPDELRPERYRVRSLVDPRVTTSLNHLPGLATPLAAAIDLAAEELRRYTRRGRPPVAGARLVVVTDGRGNIPFEASARGHVIKPIAREGVDDALAIAPAVKALKRVEAVVLAPNATPYAHLPHDLAAAMGAVVTSTAPRAHDD